MIKTRVVVGQLVFGFNFLLAQPEQKLLPDEEKHASLYGTVHIQELKEPARASQCCSDTCQGYLKAIIRLGSIGVCIGIMVGHYGASSDDVYGHAIPTIVGGVLGSMCGAASYDADKRGRHSLITRMLRCFRRENQSAISINAHPIVSIDQNNSV